MRIHFDDTVRAPDGKVGVVVAVQAWNGVRWVRFKGSRKWRRFKEKALTLVKSAKEKARAVL